MKNLRVAVIFVCTASILCIVSCSKDPNIQVGYDSLMSVPVGFPSLTFPEGNEYSRARWQLGKELFYDPILSKSNSFSCASCHLPQFAFSDTSQFSLGENNLRGTQNAPSLANIAYHPYFTRAGGVPTMEMQILVPIQEHDEFDMNILDIVERLKKIPTYVSQAQEAYGREPDAFVITRAIANFERSLLSGNSRYDKLVYQSYDNALNEQEKRGKNLFFSTRTNCSSCHGGFNFTNYAFENNGLYINYVDSGRMRLTKLEEDRDLFKVPSLRNVELTAPYMHDGSFRTLEQVVAHYNSGGKNHVNKNNEMVKPLGLSAEEQSELVAFLKTLTDHDFINQKIFQR